MAKEKESRAPLIVGIVLLLLPVLYVVSYLLLVVPGGISRVPANVSILEMPLSSFRGPLRYYRVPVSLDDYASSIYWPLEQIDRKLRPEAWDDGFERIGIDFD